MSVWLKRNGRVLVLGGLTCFFSSVIVLAIANLIMLSFVPFTGVLGDYPSFTTMPAKGFMQSFLAYGIIHFATGATAMWFGIWFYNEWKERSKVKL